MVKNVVALMLGLAVALSCGACSQPKETVKSVVEKFKAADLPISDYTIFDDNTDPNGSGDHAYSEKGIFFDSRVDWDYEEGDGSGSVEIFDSAKEAQKRADYINGFAKLDVYRYQLISNNALIRLNTAMTHEQAAEYAKVLGAEFYTEPTKDEYDSIHKIMDAYTSTPADHVLNDICQMSEQIDREGRPLKVKWDITFLDTGNPCINAETRRGTRISVVYENLSMDKPSFVNVFADANKEDYQHVVLAALYSKLCQLTDDDANTLLKTGEFTNDELLILYSDVSCHINPY